jgi:Calcium binding
MSEVKQDHVREERIDMEVVVDCYDDQERAMGWYYYLQDKINHFKILLTQHFSLDALLQYLRVHFNLLCQILLIKI